MNGVSRKKAWSIYALLLIIIIITNFFLPGIGNAIWIGLLSTTTIVVIIYFSCTSPKPKKQELLENPAESLLSSVNAPPPPPTPTPRPRLHYLDNIKSILTSIVVIHHTSMSFGSDGGWYYIIANYYNPYQVPSVAIQFLDQSYFMCLFFFISGYFTPISCDRKGINVFLGDKFKRLGIPYITYLLILGPFLGFLINAVFISHNTYTYGADAGPCWFLLWLLIFNTGYVLIDQKLPFLKVKFPSIFSLVVLYGICFGLLQMAVVVAIPDGNFIFMPITVGSLPFDILFFSAGVAAKYNGWLVDMLPNMSTCNIVTIRMLTIVCASGMFAFWTVCYVYDIGHVGIPKKNESQYDCDSDDSWDEWYAGLVWLGIYVLSGICTTMISLTIVQFGYAYLNFSNKFTKFFARSAYGVYIIHPLIVAPVTYSYQQILHAAIGQEYFFCDKTSVSKTHLNSDWYIWLGWIYCVSLSLTILWPLSYYVRQLPGLNKIL